MGWNMILNKLPGLMKPLLILAESLNRAELPWLLGGSCGLLLQGVELAKAPRDIDIYADTEAIEALHQELTLWSLDRPYLDEEGMYKSMLSHYQMEGYSVELVGGFTVSSHHSIYQVKVDNLLYHRAAESWIQDIPIRLMPLSHELVFNMLRGREDRYQAIAEVIREQPESHEELLKIIVSQNDWSQSHLSLIQQLTGMSL